MARELATRAANQSSKAPKIRVILNNRTIWRRLVFCQSHHEQRKTKFIK